MTCSSSIILKKKCGKFHPELVTSLLADWIDSPQAYLERVTKVVIKR